MGSVNEDYIRRIQIRETNVKPFVPIWSVNVSCSDKR